MSQDNDTPDTITHLSGEELLSDSLTRLRRDVANLANRNGQPETVGNRCIRVLEKIAGAFSDPDFSASESGIKKFLNYIQTTAEPVMKANQIPYNFTRLWDLAAKVNQTEPGNLPTSG